ncbi:zinc-dependent metalloprotease [Aquipuribacter nitratireducens]|uniref:Zinc-dependent metalloprotease n=1 Tax=Aquipuribacter nitratireducens TaxID=650104 RepID=A0ABW0GST0_9MICO
MTATTSTRHPGSGRRSPVDWAAAGEAAAAIAPPGPAMTREEIAELVAELRDCAGLAVDPVAETAQLEAGPDAGEVLVVDRAGWARANARSFGHLVDPVLARALERQRLEKGRDVPDAFLGLSRALNAAETGGLLAFMATKVLGQYDVLAPDGGRLLLVAPNVAQVEREIGAVPADFRLWVALHEETHRAQFGANPWLAGWFRGQVTDLLDDLLADPGSTVERFVEGLGRLPDILRGASDDPTGGAAGDGTAGGRRTPTGLVDLVQTPEQRARLDALTAVMSLLEGHADVVMDEVGPSVVPSVAQIRARFDARRRGTGPVDRVVRRLLGLEAKAAQYRDGARFVRAVTDEVGIEGFNAVWAGPDALPSPAELREPSTWVARVHG